MHKSWQFGGGTKHVHGLMWKSKSKRNDKEAVNLFAAKGQDGGLPEVIIILIAMINMINILRMIFKITIIDYIIIL